MLCSEGVNCPVAAMDKGSKSAPVVTRHAIGVQKTELSVEVTTQNVVRVFLKQFV